MRLIIFTLFLSTFFTTSIFAQDNVCLDFSGNNDAVVVNGFDISGDFTISTWFRCNNAATNNSYEERILSFGPNIRLEIGIENFSNKLWLYDQGVGGGVFTFPTNDLRDNNWHQVTYVRSGGQRSIYLDAIFIADYQGSTAVTYGDNFRIGAWTGGSSTHTFFNGKVDETRIWSVAKTQDDIQAEYSCPLSGNEADLLAYWDYDQGTADGTNAGETTLLDRSSNGRDGTLTSSFSLDGNTSNWIEADNSTLFYLDASFNQNGNELVANANSPNYQWLDCNNNFSEIAGATAETFAPGISGSYALKVSNGICTEVSECFDFIAVSAKEVLKETDVLVYPNPTTDFVMVDKKVAKEVSIVITDQLGNVLFVEKTTQQITEIDLGDLARGVYFVAVGSIVRKVVKM